MFDLGKLFYEEECEMNLLIIYCKHKLKPSEFFRSELAENLFN